MTPLQPPDSQHVEAAKGWCELHAFLEADAELEKVAPSSRAHPSVLEVRWQVYANLEKWDGALDIASAIVTMRPHRAEGWIYKASSLTELSRHHEAYETPRTASMICCQCRSASRQAGHGSESMWCCSETCRASPSPAKRLPSASSERKN